MSESNLLRATASLLESLGSKSVILRVRGRRLLRGPLQCVAFLSASLSPALDALRQRLLLWTRLFIYCQSVWGWEVLRWEAVVLDDY